jgi:hypothetical protein
MGDSSLTRIMFSLAVALVLAQHGCATVLKGTSEEVAVNSDPSGAEVSVNGEYNGTTPYVVKVPSSRTLFIRVAKTGYRPQHVTDDTSLRWKYAIGSFLALVIPLGVDLADGAAWGHDQTVITVHLEPLARATASPAATVSPPAGEVLQSTPTSAAQSASGR